MFFTLGEYMRTYHQTSSLFRLLLHTCLLMLCSIGSACVTETEQVAETDRAKPFQNTVRTCEKKPNHHWAYRKNICVDCLNVPWDGEQELCLATVVRQPSVTTVMSSGKTKEEVICNLSFNTCSPPNCGKNRPDYCEGCPSTTACR